MSNNPFINAGAAAAYIGALVLFISYVLEPIDGPETIFVPMAMISLFVLSVLVMAYTLLLSPLQLYLDGKKSEAVHLFVRTVLVFAAIAATYMGFAIASML